MYLHGEICQEQMIWGDCHATLKMQFLTEMVPVLLSQPARFCSHALLCSADGSLCKTT